MQDRDLRILSHLRMDARMPLTEMSRMTRIPVSTLFDKLREYNQDIVLKHTSIINFERLGYNARANVLIKVDRDSRELFRSYLEKHKNINSIYQINNGFDFMFETVFSNIKEMEDFLWSLEQKFKIENREVYYIIEDIKKESFMSEPEIIGLL